MTPSPGQRGPARRAQGLPALQGLVLLVLAGEVVLGVGQLAAQPFPAVTLLDQLNHDGSRYQSGSASRGLGGALANAGDIDGDGWPDLIIGSGLENGASPGEVWVVLGGRNLGRDTRLDELLETTIRLRSGQAGPDRLGASVAGVGDVDGDGLDDVLVGMPAAFGPLLPEGAAFLVFGSPRLPRSLRLDRLADLGVAFRSTTQGTLLGRVAARVGDVNGDGFSDFALGLPDAPPRPAPGARGGAGRVLLVFGGQRLRAGPPLVDLDGLTPPRGIEIDGPAPEGEFGSSIAALGDVDGDGVDDFGIGAPGLGAGGALFVIFGARGLDRAPDLGQIDPRSHVRFDLEEAGARFGASLAGGLDATGDGLPDVLVGAPGESRGDPVSRGTITLIPGGAEIRDTPRRSLPAPGIPLFRGPLGSAAGTAVALVPDVDGDGRAEILIGAPRQDVNLGGAYLAYGSNAFEAETFLERLNPQGPPRGAKFFQNQRNARLGQAVSGLSDRRGDLRGTLVLGAPGQSVGAAAGAGVVYEVLPRRTAGAPRNLACRLLPGRRVELSWNVPRVFERVVVFRGDRPIAGPLPGNLLRFVDTSPPPGLNEYFVEGDGDPALRSERCRISVRPLAVVDFNCLQFPGTTRVVVSWRLGDRYDALEVVIDGEAQGLLPGNATRFEFDKGRGAFRVEIVDPTSPRAEPLAECTVEVASVDLPAIAGLRCSAEPGGPGRAVRLDWEPSAAYEAYAVFRDERPLARVVASTSFLDADVPSGNLEYAVRGLRSVHVGPASSCRVTIEPPAADVVRGAVGFARPAGDGIVPVHRGTVEVRDSRGARVARGQIDRDGRFAVGVPSPGTYTVVYEARVAPLAPNVVEGLGLETSDSVLTAVLTDAPTGEELLVELPLPVLAVSAVRSDRNRWDSLRRAVGDRGLLFAARIPSGAGPGALAIERLLAALRAHLEEQLSAPAPPFDLLAYGFSGFAARVFAHTRRRPEIHRLVLLGTPNLGTRRAIVRLRKDAVSRPQPGGLDAAARYAAADENTPAFARQFNRIVTRSGSAEVHLVAGTGGPPQLEQILGCDAQDGVVCSSSALGGIPGATEHRVDEEHVSLGRGERSVSLLVDGVGIGRPLQPLAMPLERDGGQVPDGRVAGLGVSGFSTGNVYDGTLQPGDEGRLSLVSDTSGSVIIIFNTEPGGALFLLITPSDETISPANAAALGIAYFTYADGEGQIVQGYSFPAAEIGTYTAVISNPTATEPIEYHLELLVDGGANLTARLDPEEIAPGDSPTVRATLRTLDVPILGASVSAQVLRPDGRLDLVDLRDDGAAPDDVAADGVYQATIPPSDLPGFHVVEITASDGPDETFHRTLTLQLLVRSSAATLGDLWISGTADDNSDGVHDILWVDSSVTSVSAGSFLLVGRLTDLQGTPIGEAASLFETAGVETITVRLHFDASDVHASRRDGPYLLKEVELFDVTTGFARADFAEDVHETAAYVWKAFGLPPPTSYLRGDANADGQVDITDPIVVLVRLFSQGMELSCDEAADANDDDRVDISDSIFLLDFLFRAGPDVPAPYPACASEFLDIGCESYPPCN